jgi:hypothetical protein
MATRELRERKGIEMKSESKTKPKVVGMTDWETIVYPDGTMMAMLNVDGIGAIGMRKVLLIRNSHRNRIFIWQVC